MPILFNVLFAFVVMNMCVNIVLLYTKRIRIYKLLAAYWPSVLIVFMTQAYFQEGEFQIAIAYAASFLSLTIFAMIGFEILSRKFPLKNYLLLYTLAVAITAALHTYGYGFTAMAAPLCAATAAPILHAFYLIHFEERLKSTRLQKLLGLIYFAVAIHIMNFAIFRMEPGAQLWGWIVTYALYDCLGILLPAIALEEANISENVRLQKLVDERTLELNQLLKDKEALLKVVLHDLSSPLMTLRFYLQHVKVKEGHEEIIDKANKSQHAMEKIILEVKRMYGSQKRPELQPVKLEDCFDELSFIFGPKLEKKNIRLLFKNQLSPDTKVLADQTTLTHSVLSNLVSNGLKFSYPNSQIEVIAKEESGSIVLEVNDQGPGIPEKVIRNVLTDQESVSSVGTEGEVGTGFGLSIVKSFVNSYGGEIEFDSRTETSHPTSHGTSIRITLDRAPTQLS